MGSATRARCRSGSQANERLRRGLSRCATFWLPLGLFAVVTLFPFYWMALTSVKPYGELYSTSAPQLWVTQPTLEHFTYLFERTQYLRWLMNTMIVSVSSTAISLAFSILAGYALARLRFWGAAVFGAALGISYLVPQSLLFIPMFEVVTALGIGNTYWALILTYPTFLIPFCTFLLMGYFKSIPRELEECALIDGAGRIGAMVRVALPLAMPGILSAFIFGFTSSWNEYLYALVFMSTSTMKTAPVGVVSELIRGDVFFWGSLMAGAVASSVPVAIVYSFFVEHYVAGLTAGAVKG